MSVAGPTILLVEDNELNRDMLSRRLRARGFTVVMAVDGLAGVEAARTTRPDLILMDLGLPDIDGCEATARIKADETTRHIPIIALTAHVLPEHQQRALEAGCSDHDSKPVVLDRLLQKMAALLPSLAKAS